MDSSSGLLSLKWNNHTSTFTGVLSHLRDNNLYADAALACEGKVFSVHKLVLSTCSEYFQKIFEETDCRRPVIVLKDIKCSELDALLSYMYLGEVNVLQTDLSGLIKAAECLQVKGLAVADDVPISSLKSSSNKQDSSKTGKRVSSSSNASSSKRTRKERARAASSDEEDARDDASRLKTSSGSNESNETLNFSATSNLTSSGNSRTSRNSSQEIVLDEEIKSEVLSPKLEEEMEYSNENTFYNDSSDAAVLSSTKTPDSNSTQKQEEDANASGQSCDGQTGQQEISSNSVRCGDDDGGDGGGKGRDCTTSDGDASVCRSEEGACASPAVVSMSPRDSSTPDEVIKALRSSLPASTDDAQDIARAFASPEASSVLSRLRDDDHSNASLRGTVFSPEDFCMSRDIDLVVNSLRDQQQMNLGYYHLGGNGTSSSGLLTSISSPSSSNSNTAASAASSFLQSLQGSPYVPRSFVCETCGRRFNQKHHLRHHNYTHTGERPYSCPHCEQTFTQTSSRNKHIKTIHPYARSNSLNLESHFDNV